MVLLIVLITLTVINLVLAVFNLASNGATFLRVKRLLQLAGAE